MAKLNPILAELRATRNAHAEQFNYDVDAIFEDLRRQQAESGESYLPPPPKRPIVPVQPPVAPTLNAPHQSL